MKARTITVMAVALLAFGCGDDDENGNGNGPEPTIELDGEPADGVVNGDDWHFISGSVTMGETMDQQDEYLIVLADEDIGPCDDDTGTGRFVSMTTLALEEGDHQGGISFLDINGGIQVSGGLGSFTITSVEDDKVFGYVDHENDGDNRVEGEFGARICDE